MTVGRIGIGNSNISSNDYPVTSPSDVKKIVAKTDVIKALNNPKGALAELFNPSFNTAFIGRAIRGSKLKQPETTEAPMPRIENESKMIGPGTQFYVYLPNTPPDAPVDEFQLRIEERAETEAAAEALARKSALPKKPSPIVMSSYYYSKPTLLSEIYYPNLPKQKKLDISGIPLVPDPSSLKIGN